MIGWFIKCSVQTFQPLTLIYRRDNFVCHQWLFTSIYQPMSYRFKSLRSKQSLSQIVYTLCSYWSNLLNRDLDLLYLLEYCISTIILWEIVKYILNDSFGPKNILEEKNPLKIFSNKRKLFYNQIKIIKKNYIPGST